MILGNKLVQKKNRKLNKWQKNYWPRAELEAIFLRRVMPPHNLDTLLQSPNVYEKIPVQSVDDQ